MNYSKREQHVSINLTNGEQLAHGPAVFDPARPAAAGFDKSEAPTNESCGRGDFIARVIAVDRDQYVVSDAHGELPAELTGKLVYGSESRADLPCVGDWVSVQYHDGRTHASISHVLPRSSFLRRKSPGKAIEIQMIAANIDVAFIVQSCHYDFNVQRLERYLVMVNEGCIEPVILLTKTDLVGPEVRDQLVERIAQAGIAAHVLLLSNLTGQGVEQVRECMLPGKTYCLLGSSGVGKTTLVNHLLGESESPALETGDVSRSGEGRHTTTRRQLIGLQSGASLIDMPGMRELGMLGVSQGIDDIFEAIQAYAEDCRFTDCTHTNEPGCAVQGALARGDLTAGQFQNYLKLKRESEFHEMSYLEKRKKDRAFGHLVQSVVKDKKRRKWE